VGKVWARRVGAWRGRLAGNRAIATIQRSLGSHQCQRGRPDADAESAGLARL